MTKDRRKQRDERLARSAMSGLADCLANPNGRAFLWWFYANHADAESEGSKGRRQVARELLAAMKLADFDGLQTMRDEWEQPLLGQQESEVSDAGDDPSA